MFLFFVCFCEMSNFYSISRTCSCQNNFQMIFSILFHFSSFQSFFSERFFSMFDTDGDGSINMKELVNGLQILTKGTESEKLKFLFKVYDIDGEF